MCNTPHRMRSRSLSLFVFKLLFVLFGLVRLANISANICHNMCEFAAAFVRFHRLSVYTYYTTWQSNIQAIACVSNSTRPTTRIETIFHTKTKHLNSKAPFQYMDEFACRHCVLLERGIASIHYIPCLHVVLELRILQHNSRSHTVGARITRTHNRTPPLSM